MTAAVALVVVVLAVGAVTYGRWAGWSFGLRWWGRPTPATVRSVEPLKGALMKGGAPWAITEARHRVRATVEVHPEGHMLPYETTTITWRAANEPLAGTDVTVYVSRTRRPRVFLPRGADAAPAPEDPAAGVY